MGSRREGENNSCCRAAPERGDKKHRHAGEESQTSGFDSETLRNEFGGFLREKLLHVLEEK